MIKLTQDLYENVDKPSYVWVNPYKICYVREQYGSKVYSSIAYEHNTLVVRETVEDILAMIELWEQEK